VSQAKRPLFWAIGPAGSEKVFEVGPLPGGHIQSRSAGKTRRPKPPGCSLEQPKLSHRRRVGASHDDVVEHLHIDELQRALQFARENLVGPARLPAE
jgi:hypothetical protein